MLNKIFAVMLTVIFFMSSGIVSAEKKSVWQPEIKIGLFGGVKSVTLKFSAPSIMIDTASKKTLKKFAADENVSVNIWSFTCNEVEIRPEKIALNDLRVTISGKIYFGGVKLLKKNSALTVINIAPVEEYLRGVLPKEMIQSWHIEALKAQAVAARTFVLKNRDKHKADGYELCATTHCQVYNGAETFETTDKAVAETRGEVLFHGGRTVDAPFHADSGGMTESAANVWGGNVAHLKAVAEETKFTQAWTVKFTISDFSSRMGSAFGTLKNIKLTPLTIGKSASDRTTSGRVKSAQLIGTGKTVTMRGEEMRRKFSLPSTLFHIKIVGNEIIFEGYGKGHGVGLSQYGAKFYAEKGWKYDKILAHYYQGAKLKKLY